MRVPGFVTAMVVGLGSWAGPAGAAVTIQVDLTTQTMHVTSASGSYDWPVSTARKGFVTPRGRYGVQSLQAMHYSRKYHNSPMPHSIFFHGGYAIHGTFATASLGSAASHGCVRLSPAHAAELYGMVRAEGASISIVGSRPAIADAQVARRRTAEPEMAAYDDNDEPAVSRRRHRGDRAIISARRQVYDGAALGYAPLRGTTPAYGDWLENPFGAALQGY